MISLLKIKNLALLDEVSLELSSGFHSITGETGAGKSILLSALSLLSGSSADKTLIRQGQSSCTVEALLCADSIPGLDHFLKYQQLPPCDEQCLILKRSLFLEKPSRVWINGSIATRSQLQKLANYWIDYHGSKEPQKLFQEKEQSVLLDKYINNQVAMDSYQRNYFRWQNLKKLHCQLRDTKVLSEDQTEFYQQQLKQLASLPLNHTFIDQLTKNYQKITSVQERSTLYQNLLQLLSFGSSNILEQMSKSLEIAAKLVLCDPDAQILSNRLQSNYIEMEDLASEIKYLSQELSESADESDTIEAQMQQWMQIKRKFGGSLETVLAKKTQWQQKLSQQKEAETQKATIEGEIFVLEKTIEQQATRLHQIREKFASDLAKKTQLRLQKLGFQKAHFLISVTKCKQFSDRGFSHIQFLFSPNSGQSLFPLNKIASSGEIARVMLALKSISAENDATPVLVFDEVDANIGGEVGKAIGQSLETLSRERQIFCITHLPQVAALAPHQWLVKKEQDDNQTQIFIKELQIKQDRIKEIARMLGDRNAKSAIEHAENLINGS